MRATVRNINVEVLRQCREQMALSLEGVKKKVHSIEAIESGDKYPTFRQLSVLAETYNVPRWVFVSEQLPSEYNFVKSVPAFRQFTEQTAEAFSDPKLRGLVAQVQQLRELAIELRKDMDELMEPFSPPEVELQSSSPTKIANVIRSWLNVENNLEFQEWKEKLEQKGIFVFMTDKYKGWSHIEKTVFRGLSIYYPVLPIIIINDSDAKKAQSFTLFHELGHLLRKEHAIDSCHESNKEVEKRCNRLAGEVLMPKDQLLKKVKEITALDDIKKLAKTFSVSPYACLVQLRSLQVINQSAYSSFEEKLQQEYEDLHKKLREQSGGARRNRVEEVLNQYGRIYSGTLLQAYQNKEISLHKLSKLFNLKRASHGLDLVNKRWKRITV